MAAWAETSYYYLKAIEFHQDKQKSELYIKIGTNKIHEANLLNAENERQQKIEAYDLAMVAKNGEIKYLQMDDGNTQRIEKAQAQLEAYQREIDKIKEMQK